MSAAPSSDSQRDAVTNSLVKTTRIVSHLASHDLAFERSISPSVSAALESRANKLLGIAQNLVAAACHESRLAPPQLSDIEDLEGNWRGIVEVLDDLLEKVDSSLDDLNGRKKHEEREIAKKSKSWKDQKKQSKIEVPRLLNIPKPQTHFHRQPDNSIVPPWRPLIKHKHHASKELSQALVIEENEQGHLGYKHPYHTELADYRYPEFVYEPADPIPFLPFDTTEATWVDTPEAVQDMLGELRNAREIAIDLEHHEHRSYHGIVSLMQISTREKDWVVDTLKPWREDLQVLNEVFADPSILKVFHGAFMDILWLQRDLGLYIVGLWDTYDCTRVLGYPGHSLAYLLKRFVDFNAEKQYQLADWRARPLSTEMMKYARADTHFLLYIYDNLRNALLEPASMEMTGRERVDVVLDASRETTLRRHEIWKYDSETGLGPAGWRNAFERMSGDLSGIQVAVYKALHQWRDQTAREQDEGLQHVIPHKMLTALAGAMPTDKRSFFVIARPATGIMYESAEQICQVIKEAKLAGIEGPSLRELQKSWRLGRLATRESENRAENSPAQLVETKLEPPAQVASQRGDPEDLPVGRANHLEGSSQLWGVTSALQLGKVPHNPPSPFGLPPLLVQVNQPMYSVLDDSRIPAADGPAAEVETIAPEVVTRETATEDPNDTIFLREMSRKRKHRRPQEENEQHEAGTNEEQLDVSGGQVDGGKSESRRAKKKKRKRRQNREAETRMDYAANLLVSSTMNGIADIRRGKIVDTIDANAVVDYENTEESLLHPRKQKIGEANGKTTRPKRSDPKDSGFHPAPNRRRVEQRGKSLTFKT